ncbi:MAG: transposase [Candidatus Zixiibacteriota bacterium]
MMLLPSLENFIPKDHYLRRLDKVLNLDFIHELVADKYCQDNGRPSIDPEVVIRLFLIQAIEGITSVRKLMQRVHVDLSYRWFIGYSLDEKLPDHSTLSKALDRFGDDVFNALFERSIGQCQASGLIEGKVLHVDATTIRADIDRGQVNKPDSSDPDARYGHFPGKRLEPGYKQHTVADSKFRVIVGMSVTPANCREHDEMEGIIDKAQENIQTTPEAVCADKAYSSGVNNAAMEKRGIRFVSPPPKVPKHINGSCFTVEDFKYDKKRDIFICPAGKTLKYSYRVKARPNNCRYVALLSECGVCELKNKCTKSDRRQLEVSIYHESLRRLREDSKTDSFKKLYKTRAPGIEGIFGEAKENHGLRRAWRRGLLKMRIQALLIGSVLNFKRLAAVFCPLIGLKTYLKTVIRLILTIVERFWNKVSQNSPFMLNIGSSKF